MGRACSMHVGDEKCIKRASLESLKGTDNLKDLGIHGRIILQEVFRKTEQEGMK
jgi:hypothetical protein